MQKRDKKRKALIEQQRLKKEDVSEEEELNNDDLKDDESHDDVVIASKIAAATKKRAVKFDTEKSGSESSDVDDSLFVNPLNLINNKKKSKKGASTGEDEENQEEGFESADEDDEKMLEKQAGTRKARREEKMLGKRKKRTGGKDDDDLGDFFANTEIEVVPQSKIRGAKKGDGFADGENSVDGDGYSSMDSDDMAETRALAKVMLRKKSRNDILNSTYNRFVTHEDKSALPDWFVEDEAKHFKANNVHLITKEMIADEKKFLKAYNERPSKKVMEAKARKKKRLAKAMNKIKSKATLIAEQ